MTTTYDSKKFSKMTNDELRALSAELWATDDGDNMALSNRIDKFIRDRIKRDTAKAINDGRHTGTIFRMLRETGPLYDPTTGKWNNG